MKTKKDFNGTTKTVGGAEVKNITWSNMAGLWMGMVYDELSTGPNKWRSCTWTKSGKCNPLRPELFLA